MRPVALALSVSILVLASAALAGGDAQLPVAARPAGPEFGAALGSRVAAGCEGLPEGHFPYLGNAAPEGAPLEHFEPSGRQCDLECFPCGLFEYEPDCYDEYEDVTNGGCNSSPYVFHTLSLQVANPFQLCGRSGTYLYTSLNYRDTDWYEITLTQQTDIVFTCVAEFPLQAAILDGNPGCPDVPIIEYTIVDECVEAVLFASLPAGTYWLWVGPSVFDGVPCGSEYIMTVEGYSVSCVLECPPGSMVEGPEPCEPDYEDYYNGGCNWDPHTFLPIEPSPEMIVLCGEAWTYDYGGICYREMDWYEMSLGALSEIQLCAAAEFPVRVWIILPGPEPDPCMGMVTIGSEFGDTCMGACVEAVLEPGTYWLIIAPEYWIEIPCGASYTATLTGFTTPVEDVSWGSVKALYR